MNLGVIFDKIIAAQRELKRRGLYSGEIDGMAGGGTWDAVLTSLSVDMSAPTPQKVAAFILGDQLAKIAESQIGTHEDNAHTNKGEAIRKYQEATNLEGQGWPWCAAFVDWCIKELLANYSAVAKNVVRPKITFQDRPETASAFGLIEWAQAHGFFVFSPYQTAPQRGDIVVYAFSHAGIVVGASSKAFHAVEGNTNEAGGRDGCVVAQKERDYSKVKKFIRLA